MISDDETISQYDDFGDAYDLSSKKWLNSKNTLLLSEDSLARTLQVIKDSSFAIFTAYRAKFSKDQNIARNRKLRAFLNQNRMGVHQLVGHFIEDQGDGSKRDVVERSYLVEKPDDMSDKDFCDIIIGCLTIDGEVQDNALIKFESKGENFYLLYPDSRLMIIGSKLSLGKVGTAYSQHVKKMNVPFMFEAEERPGSNLGCIGYAKEGFCWSGRNGFGYF